MHQTPTDSQLHATKQKTNEKQFTKTQDEGEGQVYECSLAGTENLCKCKLIRSSTNVLRGVRRLGVEEMGFQPRCKLSTTNG